MNRELQNINEWFISNKLSLNVKKTNIFIFHKASKRDDLPLVLPKLFINNQVIKRQSSVKFLGILLDENLSRKEDLKLTENKIAKNIGLIFKAKPYLNKDSSLVLCFFTFTLTLTMLICIGKHTQKRALRLIHNKNRFYHSKKRLESCEILNVYKLILLNTAVFMHKIKNRTAPSSFLEKSEQPTHSYSTGFSSGNYRKPQIKLRKCRFCFSSRGPAICLNYDLRANPYVPTFEN